MNQRQVTESGGPSSATLRALFAAADAGRDFKDLQAQTLLKLDRALAWEPGSARAVIAGAQPRPLDATRTVGLEGHDEEGHAFFVRVPASVLEDLTEAERAEAEATILASALRTIREIRQARQS